MQRVPSVAANTSYLPNAEWATVKNAVVDRAGRDGTGAMTQIDRIATDCGWKRFVEPLIARNDVTETDLTACEDHGEAMAGSLALGIF